MRGVINLRGSVVPVVDLRLKFGMTQDGEDGEHLHHHRRGDGGRRDDDPGRAGRFGAGGDGPRARTRSSRRRRSGRGSTRSSSRGWASGTTTSSSSSTSTRSSRPTNWPWCSRPRRMDVQRLHKQPLSRGGQRSPGPHMNGRFKGSAWTAGSLRAAPGGRRSLPEEAAMTSILFCRARSGVYVPSLGELRQFCMNTGHLCPAQTPDEARGQAIPGSAGCWPGTSSGGESAEERRHRRNHAGIAAL